MPCRDYEADAEVREVASARLDKYARMLCGVMALIERHGILSKCSAETKEWWKQHRVADNKERERVARKARDAKDKNKLLAGLTPRERKLLGV